MANHVTEKELKHMCENAAELGLRPDRLMLLDQRLEEWSKSDMTPSIAVKVLRHGKTAFEGAYGILGPDKGEASLTTDTIFPICSLTKPVTATLLSILQEEGLIDLNEAVSTYIPEFTGDPDKLVRIWHLLTHTSGIIDEDIDRNFNKLVKEKLDITLPEDHAPEEAWDEVMLRIRDKMGLAKMEPGREMRDNTFFAVALSAKPTHLPQSVMQYCSTGFDLAMEIIKRVTGRNIDDYATEKLFGPLKMTDSHFIFPKEKLSRYITRRPEFCGGNWLNTKVLNSESGGGGLKSTVLDMTRFGQMYLNRGSLDGASVLSPSSIRELTTDQNYRISQVLYEDNHAEASWNSWSLGWNIRGRKKDDSGNLRSPESFEHGGFGCVKLLCDPVADVVAAYFTVCKTDTYYKASYFNNLVLGAITTV